MWKVLSTLAFVLMLATSTPVFSQNENENSQQKDLKNKVVFDCEKLGKLGATAAAAKYRGYPQSKLQVQVMTSVFENADEQGFSGKQSTASLRIAFDIVNAAYSDLPDVGNSQEQEKAVVKYAQNVKRACEENLLTPEKLEDKLGRGM